ncbi:ABC transporter permease [Exiguobacterium sp. TBG-PICH-001]|uniref:ABC transporter permease n=1 Tax=Exiguobacterium abrahamii TaxID=2785532 RepID=UPI0018A7A9AD|nr:ABC transporter permease [Exiguobacterium sp. TBG-PICH-001]MBF8152870.1 ABC transporter permease [Exiguobacterium sp. TBG-PICH-001]
MFRFVLNQWRRQRGKFILTLVGALIISAGLSLMFNLTDSSQGTVEQTLQKKWSSAYDIVVRPKGSQMTTESSKLLEPNYLNGINGGISFKQYQQIKQMNEVDIAAPVAVMGYVMSNVSFEKAIKIPSTPGIYRFTETTYIQNGFKKERQSKTVLHLAQGTKVQVPENASFISEQIDGFSTAVARNPVLIVGIDPKEEARLVGLDKSVRTTNKSRYFNSSDHHESDAANNQNIIPVLVNPNSFNKGSYDYDIERLDAPYQTEQDQQKLIDKVIKTQPKRSIINSPLASYPAKSIQHLSIPTAKVEETYLRTMVEKTNSLQTDSEYAEGGQLVYQSGPLQFQSTLSPFTSRWSNAFEVSATSTRISGIGIEKELISDKGFRSLTSMGQKVKKPEPGSSNVRFPFLQFKVVGLYDPKNIKVSKDPLNELPMETYRPSSADLVLDAKGEPVNPAKSIDTSGNPVGLLTSSPNILTTIDSARAVNGEQAISSVRLKIKGASTVSEASEQLLQDVKKQIEQKTGLMVTITKGSSPQPVVTKVVDDGKTLGWIEQPWIHIGAAMTIFRETSVGFSGVIFAMLAVAIVYVLATSYVSMLARRKEFAVLLALGWRTKDLYKIVLIEAAILAGFVSTVALIVEGIFSYVRNEAMNGWSLLWIALFSLVIYLAGAAWSAWTIRRISPYEAIKTGEYAKAARIGLKLRSTMTLALKELIGKWKRNSLSVLSIALPTALLTFFLFVTFHLQGVLYTSWLGQFVALQVGPMHYVTMGVAITIAVLTTGEIMWQNVTDRRASLAVLKALGWTNGAIRQLIVLEGFLVGLISGIIGLIVAYSTIYVLYDLVPWNEPLLIGVSLALPILFGVIAAFIPAQLAARVQPYQELKDAS